jgi:hypothetical protein
VPGKFFEKDAEVGTVNGHTSIGFCFSKFKPKIGHHHEVPLETLAHRASSSSTFDVLRILIRTGTIRNQLDSNSGKWNRVSLK